VPVMSTIRKRASAELDAPGLDILSDVLGLLRLRGEVVCWTRLSAPWGLSFAPEESLFFHVIERGTCLVQLSGSKDSLRVSGGDLVVLPEGCGHRLVDSRGSRVVPVMSVVDPKTRLPGQLRYGGGGAETRVLCGKFRFDERLRVATMPALPKLLHVPGSRGKPPEWLALTLRFLRAETRSSAPGRDIAMSRLIDLLFVQAIRHWLGENDKHPLGWIGALRDKRIGLALASIHARPELRWDVETLAGKAGMSRSSFAQRFVELIGEPPSQYLTRWRVHYAAGLLKSREVTIAQAAARVGYHSEAAFSRAFKRYMSLPPSAFRERDRHRHGASK
jgi:AraC family transcriptional regulator, alkane utilization regulator